MDQTLDRPIRPATPLPFSAANRNDLLVSGDPKDCYWEILGGDGYFHDDTKTGFSFTSFAPPTDAPYMVHASNAYPRLVEALRGMLRSEDPAVALNNARALLVELGEIK